MEEVKKPIHGHLVILVEIANSVIIAMVLYILSVISSALLVSIFSITPVLNGYFVSLVNFSTIFNQYPSQIYFVMFFTLMISRSLYLYLYWQKRQRMPSYSFARAVLPIFYATLGTVAYIMAIVPILLLVVFVDYSFILFLPVVLTFFIAFLSVVTSKKSIQALFRT